MLFLSYFSVSQLLWLWDVVVDLDCRLGPLGLHRGWFDETCTLPQLFCMLSSHGSEKQIFTLVVGVRKSLVNDMCDLDVFHPAARVFICCFCLTCQYLNFCGFGLLL